MPKTILIDENNLQQLREPFKKGSLIAYPTETFFALGCNPLNVDALQKIFNLKNRDINKPFPLIIKDKKMLDDLVTTISPLEEKLINTFWPGPLTIIFKAKENVPKTLTSDTHKIALRISSSPICEKLMAIINSPIISTSANIKGHVPAKTKEEVKEYFEQEIDFIIDSSPLKETEPSTIVEVIDDEINILRPGKIKEQEIFKVQNG